MQRKVSCAQKKTTCWVSSASIYPFHLCPEGYGHGHPSHSDFYVLEPVARQSYSFSSSTSPPLPLWGWAPDKGIWVQVAFLRSTATTNACQRQGHCLRWSSPNIYLQVKASEPHKESQLPSGTKSKSPKESSCPVGLFPGWPWAVRPLWMGVHRGRKARGGRAWCVEV